MSYEEKTLIRHDLLTIGETENEFSSGDFRTWISDADTSLLETLPDGRFFERFVLFESTTGRRPIVLPFESTIYKNETEQKNRVVRVDNQQSGRRAAAHDLL